MQPEQHATKTAKILYRPWGLIGSLVGGLVAGQVFQQVWKRFVPGNQDDPPKPLQSEYPLPQILVAALIQGAHALPGHDASHPGNASGGEVHRLDDLFAMARRCGETQFVVVTTAGLQRPTGRGFQFQQRYRGRQ